jgi:anti-sigma factor RsiW
MKAFYEQARRGLRRWSGVHPSSADWIALRDGQLSATQTRELEAHLKDCNTCRSECQGLDEAFTLFSKVDAASKSRHPPLDEGLERLQEQIRVWRLAQEPRIRPVSVKAGDPREPWRRVSAELEVYLGSQMTTRLIEAARQSSQEVRGILAIAKPVLTGLLGEKTAFNVTTRLFKIFAPERTLA